MEENDLFSPSDNNSDISIQDASSIVSIMEMTDNFLAHTHSLTELQPIITLLLPKHSLGKRMNYPSTSPESSKKLTRKSANKKKKKGASSQS